ncbi:MAG: AIPR family protein [Candidatus Doudnabacteria bacterium]|nr:AIPR family protein [Candidatus Doudnabacteria bacterium]
MSEFVTIRNVTSYKKIFASPAGKAKSMYAAIINVHDLPVEFENWLDINPREATETSGVAKKIRESLVAQPEAFVFKNRGLTLIANSVKFDTDTAKLTLEMSDPSIHGLLDGGHTYKVVRSELANSENSGENLKGAFLRIDLLEGFSDLDEVVDIVEARNRSAQVKDQSLEELRNHFEVIKDVLKSEAYSDRIAYKELELLDESDAKKDIDIKEILSYLVCFDAEQFTDSKHPIIAYSGKARALKHYVANRDRLEKYTTLLPKILQLVDTIKLELPKAYNAGGGKFGRLTGVLSAKDKLPFIGATSEFQTPAGFIYPVLASFRALVGVHGKTCTWKSDPVTFFLEYKSLLAEAIGEQAIEFRNPNKLGKDNATWRLCYALIALEVAKKNL